MNKKEELESAEDEKQAIIDDLMQKASLNDSQKQEYMRRLKIQDRQIAELQQELVRMRRMERNMRMDSDVYRNYLNFFNTKELRMIQNTSPSDLPLSIKEKLKELNMVDSDGDLTPIGRNFLRHILD